MTSVGIRELKLRTSDILRRVREGGEAVDVTLRGRVIARIVPVATDRRADRAARTRRSRAVWTDLDKLAVEIAARWPKGVTAARAVSEDRRG